MPLIKKIPLVLKRCKQKTIIFLNRLSWENFIHVRGETRHLVLPLFLKRYVKWLKYLVTTISLISAYFIFENANHAFIFGLITFLITSFLERILYPYTTFFVHPMPDFTVEPDKWMGMAFGFGETREGSLIPIVGMGLTDAEYGRNIYKLLLKWSCGEHQDEKRLISASAIEMADNSYIFYLYSNPFRDERLGLFDKFIKDFQDKFPDRVHRKMMMGLTLGKRCEIIPNSMFYRFKSKYTNGIPILFMLSILKVGESRCEPIEGTKEFILFDFKIKHYKELTRKDPEYDLIRLGRPVTKEDIKNA